MADITMPQLGETVTEGTITKWFKAVGDSVAEDEPLFEVSTDKVDSEVPSPVSGTLTEIKVPEGDTVDVGVVLAVIGDGAAAPRARGGRPRRGGAGGGGARGRARPRSARGPRARGGGRARGGATPRRAGARRDGAGGRGGERSTAVARRAPAGGRARP